MQNLRFAEEHGLDSRAVARANVGSCLLQLDKTPEALENFTKALEMGLLDESNTARIVSGILSALRAA